jgi:signal transduction histidine kinase
MLLPAAEEAEVDIALNLAKGLMVRGDHDELLQVAGNLIENAVK